MPPPNAVRRRCCHGLFPALRAVTAVVAAAVLVERPFPASASSYAMESSGVGGLVPRQASVPLLLGVGALAIVQPIRP